MARNGRFLLVLRWILVGAPLFQLATHSRAHAPPVDMPSLHRLFALILLCLLVFGGARGLLQSEQRALEEISVAFPALASLSFRSTIQSGPSGVYYSQGVPWPSDLSKTCQNGDGFDIFGIYCQGGSVTALFVYVHLSSVPLPAISLNLCFANILRSHDSQATYWGEPIVGSNFSYTSGLVGLQNMCVLPAFVGFCCLLAC